MSRPAAAAAIPARRRLPRGEREERMLDAGERIFGARGFRSASMDEIAEASGITKALLYQYFGSKEGLYEACLERGRARLFEDLRRSYGELARAQEELVKRERLAALGELSAVVAHEVRNPLGVIFNSLGTALGWTIVALVGTISRAPDVRIKPRVLFRAKTRS